MPEDHNVNINVRIHNENEEELEEEVERAEQADRPMRPSAGTVFVTRAQTSRYKTFRTVEMPCGKTVSEIRQELWIPFEMSEKLVASVDGESAGDEVKPCAGSRVHFSPAPKERGLS